MAACKADYQDCDISAAVKTLHCNVTAAYVRECKRYGIDMPLPDECCECDDFSHDMLDSNSERVSKTNKQRQKTNKKQICPSKRLSGSTWYIFTKASLKLTVHERKKTPTIIERAERTLVYQSLFCSRLLHCSWNNLGETTL